MFKIGEFSKLTQVSIRMLRYYDETGVLKPANIDKNTGYRLYSVEQIPILHKIIFLRDIGFSVAQIAVALNNWDKDFISKHLINKQQEIESLIQTEQARINKINIAINDMAEDKLSVNYNVSLKSIPAYQVLSLRKIIPNYFNEGLLWQELDDFIDREHLDIPSNSHALAIYHDEEHKDANVDVEVCVAVSQKGQSKGVFKYRDTEKIDTMACAMVYGPYENIAIGYEALAHWLTKHSQYRMIGYNRQICHRGPWNEKESSKYLTEIQIPVEKLFP
ncbi:MAG: MerR family transcriptional regulator [Syntrophomonas sp.]